MKRDAIRLPKRAKRKRSLQSQLKVDDVTPQFIMDVLESLDSPHGLSVAIKLRYGDFLGAVSTEIDPRDFVCAEKFADAYQSVKLISKYPFLDTGIDLEQVALKNFRDAEFACLETNQRFRRMREGDATQSPVVQAIITMAARKISRILGDVDLGKISRHFGWGPGASIGVRGRHTSAYNKFSGPLDVSRNCLVMGLACINSTPSWANAVVKTGEFPSVPVTALSAAVKMVTGSEIIFVPKNAKTHRVIAIEPSLNGYIQKGVGRYIRKRLREHAGIDLRDQSINQSLAQHGSLTGELATIDLSMASDTISKELVRELFSDEWFELFSTLRCEQGTIKLTNETVRFQKLSSMGNAFTFELESLIFYALSSAVLDQMGELHTDGRLRRISVYGDDLVVPVSCVELLLEVLSVCGFTTNKSKSFSDGPFRESCGKDFFQGTNVRPFFLKERIDNVEALYRAANGIRRYAAMRRPKGGLDARLFGCWGRLVHTIPKHFRHRIPEGYGDVGIVVDFDEATPAIPRDGWCGYRCRAIVRVPYRTVYKEESFGYTTTLFLAHSDLLSDSHDEEISFAVRQNPTLFSSEPEGHAALGQYALRDRTLPKIVNLLVRDWPTLGPWHM